MSSTRTAPSLGAVLAGGGHSFSFELFPPKTDAGEQALWQTVRELEALKPTFVSVTYGAGGSTQDRTVRITKQIAEHTTLLPVAHLTCVDASVDDLRGVIAQYSDAGVNTIMALRGDPIAGPESQWVQHPGGLQHADELVALVRSLGAFSVGVAAFPEGHPESGDFEDDARVLAAKQDAGAEFAITQFFFRAEDYERLVTRAAAHGCTMPIVPGLMPVTNVAQIERFAVLSGAQFPSDLAEKFGKVKDDQSAVHEIGVEVAAELGAKLLGMGAPGLHFYTLNRSTSTREVYEALGLNQV
jgi:methylenetetrahydrofolate reductase (NADPH)